MIEVRIISLVVLGLACFSVGFSVCNLVWVLWDAKDKRQNRGNKR